MLIFVVTWADFKPKTLFRAILGRKRLPNRPPRGSTILQKCCKVCKIKVFRFSAKNLQNDPPGSSRSSQNRAQNHSRGGNSGMRHINNLPGCLPDMRNYSMPIGPRFGAQRHHPLTKLIPMTMTVPVLLPVWSTRRLQGGEGAKCWKSSR